MPEDPDESLENLVEQLQAAIRASATYLNSNNDAFWAQKLQDVDQYLTRGSLYGVTKLLSYFGGMGSLNDGILPEEQSSRLGQLADQIKRLADL